MIAIYARQSLDQKDSISIETQIDYCKKEIVDNSEYEVFFDKGFSGKNIDRPAFSKLLNAIKERKISKVIVYRLDRISRSITDFASIIDMLEANKVDFVSANEKFDTSTPVGRAMLYIIMVFAQLERETIAERIRDNYYARGVKGVWLGGPAPLGYEIESTILDGKKATQLTADEDIGLVKRIFEMYASSSISLGGIAKILKSEYNVMWNNIKLSRILHNPVYVMADADVYLFFKAKKCTIVNSIEDFDGTRGCNLYGKRNRGANKYNLSSDHVLSIGLHEGIVNSNTWLKCQAKLSGNKQIKNQGKGKHSWITGFVKCGYCGYAMNVKVYKSFKYLNCTGRFSTNLCMDKLETHHLSDVEEYVYKEISSYVDELKKVQPTAKEDGSSETNQLKLKLIKIETEINSLIDKISTANEVLINYINERIVELDKEKTNLLDKINTSIISKNDINLPDIKGFNDMSLEMKRDVTVSLISKILVFNDKIEILWKC